MDKTISKNDVMRVIDNVMNNREITSIRNAVLAIRDGIEELQEVYMLEPQQPCYAKLPLRGNNELCCSIPWFDGAKYVVIDTFDKVDTGIYGTYHYE